ncbi:ribonucleotide reductase of class Ia (aerobic) beta subunit [Staphylococcus phage vB_SscM-1]|uniref:ribonucleoside-diphosphate reductase n=2 Tax=Sciuriunavirus SscM1 TaxID=2734053 RepID=A0A1X9I9V4_9CAUD|nr:ribonucleotide reductase of class Ia (aerobic) beta subunit [Staphylococcus phage vB_SscM-1]ANT44801.1 ribonucleotide reductase of class Ia (aerobic) beta subunit [Staphylococcus phage vB_SscM-1]ANT45003.1 ribonucleotide-diphosphate reductase beta subunit [Staphylococcus phage vB_SscM-2]
MITQIKKRDGSIVEYDLNKVTNAILKANSETNEYLEDSIDILVDDVDSLLEEKEEVLTVECVQDMVEKVLLGSEFKETAKEYILYRDKRDRERRRDIFKARKELKPYEYPELLEYIRAIQNSYWVHTEFNYTSDIQDYMQNVKPHERTAIKNAMLAIAQVEVSVKTFWGDLYHRMPKWETGAVGATFSESEVRHADAYSHLIELLGLNDEFKNIDNIPALKERVDELSMHIKLSKSEEDKDYVLSVLLFSLFIEHVSLFSQFLIMMSFNKHKNLFRGLSNAIEATSKEEQIHGLFGIELINIIREEHPEWFDEEMEKAVYEACKHSLEAEIKVIDWLYEDGELEFLPKKVVQEFIKNRLNNSLEAVGYEKLFEIDEELIEETAWFDDEVISTKLTDFLSKRSVNYTKFTNSVTEDTLFSSTSEFENSEKEISKDKVNEILRLRMLTRG